jgi:hypothetical protein
MNINDAFPSRFLKASDLDGRNVTVTIQSAKLEAIANQERKKLVLSFVGKDKQFICNKTNADTIAEMYGKEIDPWAGKRITLCTRQVEYQGSMMPALRVLLQKPEAHKTAPPPAPPTQTAPPPAEDPDDDIPF